MQPVERPGACAGQPRVQECTVTRVICGDG